MGEAPGFPGAQSGLSTLPVYVDDSMRALCGASVISEYLDETHGVLKRDRRLLAEDPFQRAEIRRLTEWFMQKMENDVTKPLARERVYKLQMTADQGGGAPDSKVLRTARANIRQHMRYLTWLAGSRQWLAGERMSYADLAAAASISILDYLGEIEWADLARRQGLVPAAEVTSLLPADADRARARTDTGFTLCRSGFLTRALHART